jgi:hypothetical protein
MRRQMAAQLRSPNKDCNIAYLGNDWVQVQTATLQECIDTCASRGSSCSGVVQVPSRKPNCYLKRGVLGADRKVIQPFPSDSAVRPVDGIAYSGFPSAAMRKPWDLYGDEGNNPTEASLGAVAP